MCLSEFVGIEYVLSEYEIVVGIRKNVTELVVYAPPAGGPSIVDYFGDNDLP